MELRNISGRMFTDAEDLERQHLTPISLQTLFDGARGFLADPALGERQVLDRFLEDQRAQILVRAHGLVAEIEKKKWLFDCETWPRFFAIFVSYLTADPMVKLFFKEYGEPPSRP